MPIYEYVCKQCDHRFEELVRASDTPECPTCHSRRLARQLSAFAVGRGGEPVGAAAEQPMCGTCGMTPGSCMQ